MSSNEIEDAYNSCMATMVLGLRVLKPVLLTAIVVCIVLFAVNIAAITGSVVGFSVFIYSLCRNCEKTKNIPYNLNRQNMNTIWEHACYILEFGDASFESLCSKNRNLRPNPGDDIRPTGDNEWIKSLPGPFWVKFAIGFIVWAFKIFMLPGQFFGFLLLLFGSYIVSGINYVIAKQKGA